MTSGVEFSNGCAEFTLKNPPPLVPSCLTATCDAAGPEGERLLGQRLAVRARRGLNAGGTVRYGPNVCTTPCDTSTTASTIESGSMM